MDLIFFYTLRHPYGGGGGSFRALTVFKKRVKKYFDFIFQI